MTIIYLIFIPHDRIEKWTLVQYRHWFYLFDATNGIIIMHFVDMLYVIKSMNVINIYKEERYTAINRKFGKPHLFPKP